MMDPVVVANKAKTMKRSSHHGDLRMKKRVCSLINEHTHAMTWNQSLVRYKPRMLKRGPHTVNVIVKPIAVALLFSAGADNPSFALGGAIEVSFWRGTSSIFARETRSHRKRRSSEATSGRG